MYQKTLDFLYSQLPQYQKEGVKAYKADLTNIMAISYLIGEPHKKIRTIHVAGTNGKGSTSHILASILQEAGYTVGLYTSPHLKDFRERIKINGEPISKKSVVKFVEKNKEHLLDIKPSFFEWTVALAFHHFAKKKVDIAVIETGLGGRLDSTNIITPEVSVITNIGMDHSAILGDTLTKIAQEKAGIIKENVPVIIGETQQEVKQVFIDKAKLLNAPLFFADEFPEEKEYQTDLKGSYQKKNINTAIQTIGVLKNSGWKIGKKKIALGVSNVLANTNLMGRWQIIQKKPTVIFDVAHNTAGFNEALLALQKHQYRKLRIVLALSKDKDRESIYKLLPKEARYYFTKGENNRLVKAIELRYEAVMFGLRGKHYETPHEALNTALLKSKKKDLVLVIGSNFMIGELL